MAIMSLMGLPLQSQQTRLQERDNLKPGKNPAASRRRPVRNPGHRPFLLAGKVANDAPATC